MTELAAIAKFVTSARIRAGMTQMQLCRASGVGLSTIQRIEQTRPPMPTARIVQKLRIVLDQEPEETEMSWLEVSVSTAQGIRAMAASYGLTVDAYLARYVAMQRDSQVKHPLHKADNRPTADIHKPGTVASSRPTRPLARPG